MRLLNVHTLEFREYHSTPPPYAIASHRWSPGFEATLKDVLRKRNTDSHGYRKVLAFTEYIKNNIAGVEWLWIDTVCIDQKSSQEVSEAINSMFKWYSNATICLAYLADISCSEELPFSDWWSRGWTLQELLAPKTVLFLKRDWEVCGSKGGQLGSIDLEFGCSLEMLIAEITGIPLDVLRDYEASNKLSVEEKLGWIENRSTTREEDMSYCLFGIFGVAIGANYGEGRERARLRLLREISMEQDSQIHASVIAPVAIDPPSRNGGNDEAAVQMLMESLYFPQMDDRRESISRAHAGTYRWALLSTSAMNVRWSNFVAWLSDPEPVHRVYWVNAKPGAGKSGLIRFLDEELHENEHMYPWTAGEQVLRLNYYFWSPGNALQKSLAGVIRTMLHQVLDAMSESLLSCVPRHKLQLARRVGGPELKWSDIELRECFRKVMTYLRDTVKVFVVMDGLDEIDGDDDSREDLVAFLQELANFPNVKLCVSSRRWPLFQDAFDSCPQLRLEDLNAHDIQKYVTEQLQSQSRFQQLPGMDVLIRQIIAKADGVFLWTRLVVRDLVRGIRNGDSLEMLQQKLHTVPGDLNEYFKQLLHSIEPHHRLEAGIFLQLALHQEEWFIALNPLRLLDLIFIGHADTDFALSEHRDQYMHLFDNADALIYTLDSTLRRLSSRCKGLLQCNIHWPGLPQRAITALPDAVSQVLRGNKHMAFNLQIDFMHRSLRDYLLESGSHELIGQDFDVRNYLLNARLMLITMGVVTAPKPRFDVGLASYFICTLSIPPLRDNARCVEIAAAFRPVIESVMRSEDTSYFESYWYICRSLDTWKEEQSNFMTLAIDFGLTGYIAKNLTAEDVQQKRGRPLLDYVLRPRFGRGLEECTIGNHYPIPDLVQGLLQLGADPNQVDQGTSVWERFLSYAENGYRLADGDEGELACVLSMEHLIKGGADLSVSFAALSLRLRSAVARTLPAAEYESYLSLEKEVAQKVAAQRSAGLQSFRQGVYNDVLALGWGVHTDISDMRDAGAAGESMVLFNVQDPLCDIRVLLEDVLECMRPGFGDDIDKLKMLISQRREESAHGEGEGEGG